MAEKITYGKKNAIPMPPSFRGMDVYDIESLAWIGRQNLYAMRKNWLEAMKANGVLLDSYIKMAEKYGDFHESSSVKYSRTFNTRAERCLKAIEKAMPLAVDKPLFACARERSHFKRGDTAYIWLDHDDFSDVISRSGYFEVTVLGYECGGDLITSTPYAPDDEKRKLYIAFDSCGILSLGDLHYLCYDPEYREFFFELDCIESQEVLDVELEVERWCKHFSTPPVGFLPSVIRSRPSGIEC